MQIGLIKKGCDPDPDPFFGLSDQFRRIFTGAAGNQSASAISDPDDLVAVSRAVAVNGVNGV